MYKALAISLSIICFNVLSADAQKKKEKPALDGKTFIVETAEIKEGKTPKPLEDEINFKQQKITSKVIEDKLEFDADVKYTINVDSTYTEEDGEAQLKYYEFTAEGTNSKGELLKWEGTINNADIEGTIKLSKKDKVKKQYTFSGKEKEKKKKK